VGNVVATNKRCKKIMLNKQSFQSVKIYKISSDFDELYLRNERRFFNSVLIL